jgi:hypothetical protein
MRGDNQATPTSPPLRPSWYRAAIVVSAGAILSIRLVGC